MLTLGALAFTAPWILAALIALPIIWWLLRVTPPAPKRVLFPAIRLLFQIRQREETPARTPWWLILLRLVLAALVILSLAGPVLNPSSTGGGSDPLVVIVDNGWTSARQWDARQAMLDDLLAQAERDGRTVAVLTSAPQATGEPPRVTEFMAAVDARAFVQSLAPQPWPVDRVALAGAVDALTVDGPAQTIWLADGVRNDDGDMIEEILEQAQRWGRVTVVRDDPRDSARMVGEVRLDGDSLIVPVHRLPDAAPDVLTVVAYASDGRVLARVDTTFGEAEDTAEAVLSLPSEVRNELGRVDIEGEASAGAVALIDSRWQRRPVGLITDQVDDSAQPLLGELYYVERALDPFAELVRGPLDEIATDSVSVLALTDSRALSDDEIQDLTTWISNGGVLVRFAGPRLAEEDDGLVPVPLRFGDRQTGGAMSWSEPVSLASFDDNSPFRGLVVPPDVLIERQVLAQPTVDLGSRTWARLDDGTPLVTAQQIGDGWLVLFHVTANTNWSTLPLSGLFVDMLRRLVDISAGVIAGEGESGGPLQPVELLNGFGQLVDSSPIAAAIDPATFQEVAIGPRNPPGFYGLDAARTALNIGERTASLEAWPALPAGVVEMDYATETEIELGHWLLLAAFVLLLVDMLIGLALRGLLSPMARSPAAILIMALVCAAAAPPNGYAQSAGVAGDDLAILEAVSSFRLAYVETGIPEIDEVSRAGLQGLSIVLTQRTSVEPGEPVGVDPNTDELAFFPLIYWPVVPEAAPPTAEGTQRLNDYLRFGGVILFDTRDAAPGSGGALGGASDATLALRGIAEGLDIPPLTPTPPNHVLAKAFYLLDEFPGRFVGGDVWVEQGEAQVNDGVSSVIIGGHDWAGAWAIDMYGRGVLPVQPGGERQREMAFRFGVNLVMYALTGNYKADQVHIPAILERLGQ